MNPRSVESDIAEAATAGSDVSWSFRLHFLVRWLVCIVAGIFVGVIGTLGHRMGAAYNVPYGLVLALAIVAISTWSARARSGVTGLALHLIASSAMAWLIAMGFSGDVLTPIGFGDGASVPYFSEHVGYIWLFGMVIVQLIFLFMPRQWFVMPEQRRSRQNESDADNSGLDDTNAVQSWNSAIHESAQTQHENGMDVDSVSEQIISSQESDTRQKDNVDVSRVGDEGR